MNFCNEARFDPGVRFQASSTDGVIDRVSAGRGIAIVPASAATFHTSSVTFRRLINPARPGSIGFLCRTGDTDVSIAFAIPDKASSSLDTEESRQSRNRSTDEWVILVEAVSETRLLDFVQAEMTQLRRERWGLSPGDLSKIFQLQVRVGQE
nr:LysR substrate-binding domain-containing protein [Paraburkholderia steynii]